ncbi:hypothetical protein DPMN_028232 [Dreissena polymorpha]|uniref:Uncharacterized protein n=1 Tax=Dreissena polymorpha TaxID=45954 RepID=A0A9D4LV22_DREPO|nr:hypothetical protein DPMN_028232 [Dreissena polymorpha]
MRLLVAYKGNRREDVGFLKTGLLSLTPKTFVDLNKWQRYERLLKQLKTPVCLDEELPAGNLHLGLVHSHLSGYMCYVAEEFAKNKNWSEKCDDYRKQYKLMIEKFLLVVPKTYTVPQQLPSDSIRFNSRHCHFGCGCI